MKERPRSLKVQLAETKEKLTLAEKTREALIIRVNELGSLNGQLIAATEENRRLLRTGDDLRRESDEYFQRCLWLQETLKARDITIAAFLHTLQTSGAITPRMLQQVRTSSPDGPAVAQARKMYGGGYRWHVHEPESAAASS